MRRAIYEDDVIKLLDKGWKSGVYPVASNIHALPSAQPEITKEYNLKKIYNIYVKLAQAHIVYQPLKPETITAMPFDWLAVQNLLEKYLEDHGADFDALYKEYVSENVKDDHSPSAQSDNQVHLCDSCKHNYPDCPSGSKDVIFGNAKGNDNICACSKYKPSAQSETSEWIEKEVYHKEESKMIEDWQSAKCKKCGRYHTTPYMYCFTHYAYCPHCGADMR